MSIVLLIVKVETFHFTNKIKQPYLLCHTASPPQQTVAHKHIYFYQANKFFI